MTVRYTVEMRTETGEWTAFSVCDTPEQCETEFETCKKRAHSSVKFIRIRETTDVIRASYRLITDFVPDTI